MMHQLEFVKEFSEVFANFFYKNFNTSLNSGNLSAILKSAEVMPIYKKKDKKDKYCYRPVSILNE